MRPISLKTGFLAFTFVAIASTTGGLLTACSDASQSQSQAPATSTTDTAATSDMGHGSSMNHSMAMDLGPADTNYDLRFIDAMRLHHRGAIAMAKEAELRLGDMIWDGICITKYGHSETLNTIQIIESAHPVPRRPTRAGCPAR